MQLVTRPLSEVSMRPVTWLWPGRVPRGKVTMLAGDPGLGKSFITMDLAARITVNADMPDSKATTRTPGTVLVLSAEDDAADTIRPRIEAAGGDPSRVVIVDGVRRTGAKNDDGSMGVRLDLNMPAVEKQIQQMERPRLIVIDPITAYLGEVDGHSNAQVRGLLSDLSRMAARLGPAVLCVSHLNKSGAGKAVYRLMGSLAFTAAARIVWQVSKDPQNPERRLLVLVKSNLDAARTGLAFRVRDGRVEWEASPVTIDASALEDDSGAAQQPRSAGAQRNDEATEFIEGLLQSGPTHACDVLAAAAAQGFSEGAARRAKHRLGVESFRTGSENGAGVWMWRLPAVQSERA